MRQIIRDKAGFNNQLCHHEGPLHPVCHDTPHGRRQILGVTLPGDFLALKLNFVRQARYNVEALTATEAALIEPMRIIEIYLQYPVIASSLDWTTVPEFNLLSEHIVSMGARSAVKQIVHFQLEIWCRLALIGQSTEDTFEHHLNQQQLTEAMGSLSFIRIKPCKSFPVRS